MYNEVKNSQRPQWLDKRTFGWTLCYDEVPNTHLLEDSAKELGWTLNYALIKSTQTVAKIVQLDILL